MEMDSICRVRFCSRSNQLVVALRDTRGRGEECGEQGGRERSARERMRGNQSFRALARFETAPFHAKHGPSPQLVVALRGRKEREHKPGNDRIEFGNAVSSLGFPPLRAVLSFGSATTGTTVQRLAMVEKALLGIRAFLESKSCYDILPESFRLIVFDNKLSITRSLQALVTNGQSSRPFPTHSRPIPPRSMNYSPSTLRSLSHPTAPSTTSTDTSMPLQVSFPLPFTIPLPNASPECSLSPTSCISSNTTTSPRTSTKTSSPK